MYAHEPSETWAVTIHKADHSKRGKQGFFWDFSRIWALSPHNIDPSVYYVSRFSYSFYFLSKASFLLFLLEMPSKTSIAILLLADIEKWGPPVRAKGNWVKHWRRHPKVRTNREPRWVQMSGYVHFLIGKCTALSHRTAVRCNFQLTWTLRKYQKQKQLARSERREIS